MSPQDFLFPTVSVKLLSVFLGMCVHGRRNEIPYALN